MSSSGVNDLETYLIPLKEIIRATENFSQQKRIGEGGFGVVYKGQLSDRWQNRMVAIKRLQGKDDFHNELEMIFRFHHVNIISFIGYCDEGSEMIIAYEYATNKSLDYYLADPTKMCRITWIQRLKICMGAARGLDYLHSGLGEHNRVIHRDVKSANILLDANFVAKICDFGLSKVGPRNQPCTEIDTKVAGTHYYMDPTYQESGILRKESDVYSFGVVLFEILSGTLVNYRAKNIGGHPQILMNLVRNLHLEKLIDDNIRDQVDSGSLDTFKEIAYQCISLDLSRRPTLDTVIKKIGEALFIQMTCMNSSPTPATHSKIEERFFRKLNSGLPYDLQTTNREICFVNKINADNPRISFAKAKAIPLLIDLLKTLTPWIQEHAVTTLLNLSRLQEENKRIIVSSGAVRWIIHVLRKGSMEAQVNAAATLSSLAEIYENKVIIGDAGAIPPLLLVLIYVTGTWRKVVVITTLFNLCLDPGNKKRVVRAGIIPILMELLNEPEGVVKDKALTFLSILSTHRQGMLAIGKAEVVVPVMVEFVGSGSPKNKEDAASVLVELCNNSGDIKYLVEAHQHGIWGKVTDLLQYGTNRGKEKAGQLLEKLEEHHLDKYPAKAQIRDAVEPPSDDIILIGGLFSVLILVLMVYYLVTTCRDLYYNFSIRGIVSGLYGVVSKAYGALSWNLLIRLIGSIVFRAPPW